VKELAMKKLFFLVVALNLILSACSPAAPQPQATNPVRVENLEATAAIFAQQTLQSLPTQTIPLSATPVVMTPTETPTQPTSTETQNPILLTLTATLGTGTVTVAGTSGTLPITTTPSATPNPAIGVAATGTAHLQYSGTMPPNLPFGEIKLTNKSKADVYISLRCVTKDGYVTIIESPVKSIVTTRAPAGKYTYVVWVGGNKIIGDFALGKSQDINIKIYKQRVEIN
jgi:hypothetical protein